MAMMSRSKTVSLTSPSSSRLSPLAKPFTFNRSNRQISCASGLESSSLDSSLGAQGTFDGVSVAAVPYSGLPFTSQYLLEDFEENDEESFGWTNNLLNQGKYEIIINGLNSLGVSSDGLHGKCTSVLEGKDNQSVPWLTEQLDASRVTPLMLPKSQELCSTVILHNVPHCQLSNHESTDNMDFGGNHAVKKNDNSSLYRPSSIMEPHISLSTNGKETLHNSDLINSEKERKYGKRVFGKETSSSYMKKSELKITCPSFFDDFTSKSHGVEASVAIEDSSVEDVDSELKITCPSFFIDFTSKSHGVEASVAIEDSSVEDVDSPCWKGTLASCKSPFSVSRPVCSLVQNEKEASTSLNPLACQFFPSYVKGKLQENETVRNDSSSLQQGVSSSAFNLFCGEHKSIDSVKSRSCTSEVVNSTGLRYTGNNCGGKQESGLPNNSKGSSLLNIPHMVQSRLLEHHTASKVKPLIDENFTGFLHDINEAEDSATIYFPKIGHVSSLSSSEVGVHNHSSGTLQGISDSLSAPSDINVQIVKSMHSLSELLVLNCSKEFDSFNQHERDIIQCIINNLQMCIGKGIGQSLWCESSQPGTSYSPRLKEVLR